MNKKKIILKLKLKNNNSSVIVFNRYKHFVMGVVWAAEVLWIS